MQRKKKIELTTNDKLTVVRGRATLEKLQESGSVYGANTGVGPFFNETIRTDTSGEFQRQLLLSHATGTGPLLSREEARGMMFLLINMLKKGYSGISLPTLDFLVELYNRDIIPAIPSQGSLGASGDLAPLAHLALVLIGDGNVLFCDKAVPTKFLWEFEKGIIKPIQLQKAFDREIHRLRPHDGQKNSAIHIQLLCEGMKSHESTHLQDAYSLRCIPQVHGALKQARTRYPFVWTAIHSDNGTEFINWELFRYCENEGLDFSRSRPYKKNDNCLVEQKNWTHVKKFVGYHRYDTDEELEILRNLYRNELRLYKNFLQPVIKLVSKERVGGKISRRYDKPKTPYQRVMESEKISENKKQDLKKIYLSLNPAQLKRVIDAKLTTLSRAYQKKYKSQMVESKKKQAPHLVRFFIAQPEAISVR